MLFTSSPKKAPAPSRRTVAVIFALGVSSALGIGGYLFLSGARNAQDVTVAIPHEDFCLGGCPTGMGPESRIVQHHIFTLSNNAETKFADWVAYEITPQSLNTKRCARAWRIDPALPPAQTLDPADYKRLSEENYQRGHLAPLASLCGTPYWLETNYMSNVAPQRPGLNGGAWEKLEQAERALVGKKHGYAAVFSITGPLYEDPMPALPHTSKLHVVPSGFWKIVGVERDGRMNIAAFAMDQSVDTAARFCSFATTVKNIEERTNLRFFPAMNEGDRTAIKPRNSRKLLAELGCS